MNAPVPEPSAGGRAAGLAAVFDRLAAQHGEMTALLAEDDAALMVRADRVSGWSVAQQLEHLGLTGGKVLDALDAILREPAAPPRGRVNLVGRLVLLVGRIPRGRVKARPEWSPQDSSRQRAREGVETLAARTTALASRAGELAAARGTRAHPVLGQLDARRWLRFLAIHQDHHLRLVHDIRRANGLPVRPPGADS